MLAPAFAAGPGRATSAAPRVARYFRDEPMHDRMDPRPNATAADAAPNIRWDDSGLRSLYSNVCNVTGTREEVILLFGVHQAWRPDQKELTVQLQDRVILNPHAAKRLHQLLGRVIQAYEARYGALQSDGPAPGRPPEPLPHD
jgi:hypothetical protein